MKSEAWHSNESLNKMVSNWNTQTHTYTTDRHTSTNTYTHTLSHPLSHTRSLTHNLSLTHAYTTHRHRHRHRHRRTNTYTHTHSLSRTPTETHTFSFYLHSLSHFNRHTHIRLTFGCISMPNSLDMINVNNNLKQHYIFLRSSLYQIRQLKGKL